MLIVLIQVVQGAGVNGVFPAIFNLNLTLPEIQYTDSRWLLINASENLHLHKCGNMKRKAHIVAF